MLPFLDLSSEEANLYEEIKKGRKIIVFIVLASGVFTMIIFDDQRGSTLFVSVYISFA